MRKAKLMMLFVAVTMALLSAIDSSAQKSKLVVRLAKLKIDSVQLEAYTAALKEEIETSIRVEPGVLTLNAVADKANPTHITILEIYADQQAYEQHIQTPHFKKYKSLTLKMVKSLELVETVPIILGSKQEK
ncbi:MAG: antibiotic biosynthesis monooxygenase [Cyclobacteriaceae bacterium]|nr:antibiotic biosynthesis monooxygenase [Cyclobacteriaceae bacterium]